MRLSTAPVRAPVVVATPAAMLALSSGWRLAGHSIGLVPTMGALHAGHMSLVERARAQNDRVAVSIFVNPLQFGPGEDFRRYPRRLEDDLGRLAEAGIDAVYTPSPADMYPSGTATKVHVERLAEVLEGAHRPGHFDGVATVVTKLFNAVRPDRAYFGQKDAQQVAIIKRLARDLDTGVVVVVAPTVREPDGLALSSRNIFLSAAERVASLSLSRALRTAATAYADGERDAVRLKAVLTQVLAAEPLARVDYAEVVDPQTFEGLGTLAVIAARIGGTRLIDNHDLSEPAPG